MVLVDVGARGGLSPHWLPLREDLSWVAFEADPQALAEVGAPGRRDRLLEVPLYHHRCSLDFYLTRRPRLSSLLSPDRSFLDRFEGSSAFEVVDVRKVSVDTMDNQLVRHGIDAVDFVKIDTQGSELYVLQGAERTLAAGVFGLEVEVGFAARYEGQPLFGELDGFVQPFGFHLIDLRIGYWKRKVGKTVGGRKGQMVLGEALYFRRPERFAALVAPLGNGQRWSRVLHAVLICELYGYVDYALELLAQVAGMVDETLRLAVVEQLAGRTDGCAGWATVSATRIGNLGEAGLFDYQPDS